MPAKSISLSVRLSPEEAGALASLKFPDAATPSDKIRMLINRAASESSASSSYADQLHLQNERLIEISNAIAALEEENHAHSELLGHFARWLPDIIAFYLTQAPDTDTDASMSDLETLERGVADRIFFLFDHVLRLGVTGESPCYDRDLISSRARSITKLANLISHHLPDKEKNNG